VISNLHNKYVYFATDRTVNSRAKDDSFNGADHSVFDMEIILQATDNFSIKNVVGQGGFGIVYKVIFF
jgi:hypothetical protein